MLQEVEQKLTDVVSICGIDAVLIEHEENNTTYLGIHEVYGHKDEDHCELSWSEEPIFYAETLEELRKGVAKISKLLENAQIITETDLQQFNWNLQKKRSILLS